METNTAETRVEKLKTDNDLIKKYETYEHVINVLQMILDNDDGRWIDSKNCISNNLGQKIVIDCIERAGWKVDPEYPKISSKYVRKLDEVLSKCPFNKKQAISFVRNKTGIVKLEESKSFWDWLLG